MIERLLASAALILSPVVSNVVATHASPNKGVGHAPQLQFNDYVAHRASVATESRFSEEEVLIPTPIPFEVDYVDDQESEIGSERVLKEGREGRREETFLVKYWQGEEIGRELVNVEVRPSQNQVVARGTKIIWRDLGTADYGNLRYWRKIRVWATSYDGNCLGCRGRTFSGTPVTHGTLAVDPALIPLGTRVYVPGYGIGKAEDIGGAIKGERIDLGFEDVAKGWWQAQWTDIYLLD